MNDIPKDAPENTIWFGGEMQWFSISLRIFSNKLDPNLITKILKIEPSQIQIKGIPINKNSTKVFNINKWEISIKNNNASTDINTEIQNIISSIKNNRSWGKILKYSNVDLFIGMVMKTKNKGIELNPNTMKLLGVLKIHLGFDVYFEEEKIN